MITDYYFLLAGLFLSIVCSYVYHTNKNKKSFDSMQHRRKMDVLWVVNGLLMVASWTLFFFSFRMWYEALATIILVQSVLLPIIMGFFSVGCL